MIANMDRRIGLAYMLRYPLISGIVVGLILGYPVEGAMIAATLALAYFGIINVGGSVPPDFLFGGTAGTALSIEMLSLVGGDASTAIAVILPLIIPLSVLSAQVWMFSHAISVVPLHMADKWALNLETGKMAMANALMVVFYALIGVAPLTLMLFVGPTVAATALQVIPSWLMAGLAVGARVLSMVGLGILLSLQYKHSTVGFFLLGFFFAAYLGVSMIGITIIAATLIGVIYYVTTERG